MKKLTALAIALTMLLSFSACNSESGGSADAGVTTAKTEAVKDETEKAETTAPETTTEETTTTEAAVEFVEPAAEDFEYQYDAGIKGVKITNYTGRASAIRIPAEIDGDPVVQIGDGSKSSGFPNYVTDIELPDSITNIAEYGFQYAGFKSITIPDGVTVISASAFNCCKSLESVIIPDSVTEIGSEAFAYCSSLKEFTIPNGVEMVGYGAFEGCQNLESITFPENDVYISSSAFSGCESLTSVTIPGNVLGNDYNDYGEPRVGLSYAVFRRCTSLKEVTILDGSTFIGNGAFQGCENLEKATMPNSVTIIGSSAFEDCKKLKDVSISEGLTTISSNSFKNCESLRDLAFPDSFSIFYLGGGVSDNDRNFVAFKGCDGLTVTYKGNEYNYTNWKDLYAILDKQ